MEDLKCKLLFPHDAIYADIVRVLKLNPKTPDQKLKAWQKKAIVDKLQLVLVEGTETVFCKKSNKRILKRSDFDKKFDEVHIAANHPGRDVTLTKLKEIFAYVPRPLVELRCKNCHVCQKKRSLPKPPTGKPIYAKGVMHRLQVDLIDMRANPDGEYKWIIQLKDHFSKYAWAAPLPSKEAHHVASFLRNIFYTFGPPKILQSDNGREFTADVVKEMVRQEFPSTRIVHGRPRHPETQGCIERANQLLERRLCGRNLENNSTGGWAVDLPRIMHEINTSYTRSIKDTPFHAMFLRQCRNRHTVNPDSTSDNEYVSMSDGEATDQEARVDMHDNDDIDRSLRADESDIEGPALSLFLLDDSDQIAQPDSEEESPTFRTLSSMQIDSNVAEDTHNEHSGGKPCLLFLRAPQAKAVGIAYRVRHSSVHGRKVPANCAALRVDKLLCTDVCAPDDPYDEPVQQGAFVIWPKNLITYDLGHTVDEIMQRVPQFSAYLINRLDQQHKYDQSTVAKDYSTGDVVLLKRQRLDRSNLCAPNVPARVVDVRDGNLKLQTEKGILAQRVHKDQVVSWSGGPPDCLADAPTDEVAFVMGLRAGSSYDRSKEGNSLCKCKSGCKTKQCPCIKSSIQCGTKCHPGIACHNV